MKWFSAPRSLYNSETITILKSGVININRLAYQNYFKNNEEQALLGYDEDTGQVAIKLIDLYIQGSYRVRGLHGKGAAISAKTFLEHFGIPYDTTHSYQVKWDDDLKALTFHIGRYCRGVLSMSRFRGTTVRD